MGGLAGAMVGQGRLFGVAYLVEGRCLGDVVMFDNVHSKCGLCAVIGCGLITEHRGWAGGASS